jgi:hypothetical protein
MNLKETGGTKNKARLFKILTVTGRTIAYACVQASSLVISIFFCIIDSRKTYIALSTMKRWGSSNDLFYLDEFYDGIVTMFEQNAESLWVEETLKWWNEYAFYLISNAHRYLVCLVMSLDFARNQEGRP